MRRVFFLLTFLLLSLVGCSKETTTDVLPDNTNVASEVGQQEIVAKNEPTAVALSYEQQVIEQIVTQAPEDWSVQLPQAIPVSTDQYVSASTFRSSNRLSISFYESKHKLEVNSASLQQDATFTGELIVSKWKSEEAAKAHVAELDAALSWHEGFFVYEIRPQLYEQQWRQLKKHIK